MIDLYKCFLVAVCSAPPKYFYLSTISLLLETLKQKGSCGSCQSSSQTGCLLVHTVCLGDFDGVLLCFRYTGIDALALLQNWIIIHGNGCCWYLNSPYFRPPFLCRHNSLNPHLIFFLLFFPLVRPKCPKFRKKMEWRGEFYIVPLMLGNFMYITKCIVFLSSRRFSPYTTYLIPLILSIFFQI